MATLVFSALGSLIGGPLGGAIGALVGRSVDGAIFGPKGREGPRLTELAITTSSYGTPIPRQFGRMRAAGSIIWATDLAEHKQKQGNGKGRPSTTTYSYTASFAVALSSRPIIGIGRIWADGNLLRGAAEDLKTAGSFRVHTGAGDQAVDPLIAAAEGTARCPAFRGLAYAVFEDLELGDFGNRIPTLSFEIFADTAELTVGDLIAGVIEDIDAAIPLPGVTGIACDGAVGEVLAMLDPMFPMDCDAGERLVIARDRTQSAALPLPEAVVGTAEGAFGAARGFSRKRSLESARRVEVLRYYDVDRDFQPGVQRASGRPAPGQPQAIELPAALDAVAARSLINAAARRAQWARQALSWRTAQLDPAIAPGAIVTVPDQPGRWRVREWEWRESGIELALLRESPVAGIDPLPADPGRSSPPADLPLAPTALAAFELPWDGSGSGDTPAIFAAVSSAGAGWTGAALFVDPGDGSLDALGPSGRSRSTLGTAVSTLPPGSPLLFDRSSTVTIELLAEDFALTGATADQLTQGANRALIGGELLQFARVEELGNRRWRLSGLLRGRGGTEVANASHAIGETFVLLDTSPVSLDAAPITPWPAAQIAALGLADSAPVAAPIVNRGATRQPLSPVHGSARLSASGEITLRWTRRSRGAWLWLDGVDVPLHESSEAYVVIYGPESAPLARWELTTPQLTLSAAAWSALASPGATFAIRQRGDYARSPALVVAAP